MVNKKINLLLFMIWSCFNVLVVFILFTTESNIEAIIAISCFSGWGGLALKDYLHILHIKDRSKNVI